MTDRRKTKIVFVSEVHARDKSSSRTLYAVMDRATGRFVYGPASWKACCAWKQGRPHGVVE